MLFVETRRVWRLTLLALHLLFGVIVAHIGLRLINKIRCTHQTRSRYQQAASRWWNRGLCRILKLNVRHIGRPHNGGATLFVANHISWLDISCLAASLDAHFVAKQEVREWPVFGPMVAQADTLFLERGNADATAMMADKMTRNLLLKKNLLMFPEGTSSTGESVDHFHARLFQAAVRSKAQVQAIAVAYPHAQGINPVAPFVGDDNLLRHLWCLAAQPGIDVTLTFCAPFSAAGMARRAVATHARSQVLRSLADTTNIALTDEDAAQLNPDFNYGN